MTIVHLPELPSSVQVADPTIVAATCDLVSKVSEFPAIQNDAMCIDARTLMNQAGALSKAVAAAKAKVRKPLADVVKEIDAAVKPLLDSLDGAVALLKIRLEAYRVEQEAREAARLAALDIGDGRTVPLDLEAPAPVAIPTRTYRDVVITDERLVPDEYWVIDMARVREDVLAGIAIPGTAIKTTKDVVNR